MAKINLTLVLPGLAEILEQQINASIVPRCLANIIAKAQFKEDLTGLSRLLFNHFSLEPLTGSDLPLVNLATGENHALCADPCYLHADRDRLLLFTDIDDLNFEESAALISEIQDLFDDVGADLRLSSENKWILQLSSMPEVEFSALPEVSGKSVDQFLPKGLEQQDWIRLWNEVQMKLYASEINQCRIEDNKVPINSVWFWGGGEFKANPNLWSKVNGKSDLLTLLAAKADTPLHSTDFSVDTLTAGKHLWLAENIEHDGDWLRQIETFDERVLKPIWQHCKAGNMSLILEIPEHGSYQLNPLDCWKFWKS